MDLKRIDMFLTERRMTTKVEMTKAERELKLAKGRDIGVELYADFTKFLAVYLNTLKSKELSPYKIITREKAEELVSAVVSTHPNMQAVLDKLNLDPKSFVSRFWSKMDMKQSLQDAVMMLLKGEQNVTIATVKKDEQSSTAANNKIEETKSPKETPEEAGYTIVKLKGKELTLKNNDTDKVELWACNPGGVPGYAIVYKNKQYEFVREVK
jgi:hypothetical protein